MADADAPQVEEEEKGAKAADKKEEEEDDENVNNEQTEEERAQEAAIQKKLEEIMGRDPKPWPGDGLKEYEAKDEIEFKWTKGIENRRQCDTMCMLFLLQEALELVRKRTNERNKEFKRINRKDRFISHLDGPQIVTNFLDWFNEDPEKNVFDGKLIYESEEMHVINEVIAKIGKVKLGPATKIIMKLKDVHVRNDWYSKVPPMKLHLKTRGYDRLVKADKVIGECSLDELITILSHTNDADEKVESWEGPFEKQQKKGAPVTKEENWKESIIQYFRDNAVDGKALMEADVKNLTTELCNAVVPATELTDKGKPRNLKLKGSVKAVLNQLKGCPNPTQILGAGAAKPQEENAAEPEKESADKPE